MANPKEQNRPLKSRKSLEQVAVAALSDDNFTRERGYCQKFVRQVIQRTHGSKFDGFHKATAHLSAEAWKGSPYAVDPSRGSVPGDILYKFATKRNYAGHVGIRVLGNRVAENSTVHTSRAGGAKGVRDLKDFGKPDLIVRLPKV